MKKFYLFFLFSVIFATLQVAANTITVKGYVKSANGNPVKNAPVRIAVYLSTATTSCSEQTALTNNDGFYSEALTCTGDIYRSRISVINCDGQTLVQEKQLTSTKIVEANFILCELTPATCTARFTFEKLGPKKFRFNSSTSSVDANDNVAERKWDFGDGSTSTDISPAHEFTQYGNYQVCLTIKTVKGCESKTCVLVKTDEIPSSDNAPIKIISLYPVPVHENLIAIIYSKNNNIKATIEIVDVFGKVQIQQQVILFQGSYPITTRVYALTAGSYFFKVTTQFGKISVPFYKL